jgi:hypothetical protein
MKNTPKLKLFDYSNKVSESTHKRSYEGPYVQVQIMHMIKAGIIRADALILDKEGGQYELSYFLDQEAAASDIKLKRIDIGFGNAVEVCLTWMLAAIPAMIIATILIFGLTILFGGVFAGIMGGI